MNPHDDLLPGDVLPDDLLSDEAFFDHLLPEDVQSGWLLAVPPEMPGDHAALRQRVLQEALASMGKTTYLTVRRNAGEWQALAPGVAMRMLHQDRSGSSFLLRMEAGATYPAHPHTGNEECMLLEGDLSLGGLTLAAGDYHLAPAAVDHGLIRTRHGALAFIRSAAAADYPAAYPA